MSVININSYFYGDNKASLLILHSVFEQDDQYVIGNTKEQVW